MSEPGSTPSSSATPLERPAAAFSEVEPLRSFARRLVTIPTAFLGLAAALATAPLWIPLGALVDVAGRGRRSALRCGLFLTWYLLCESIGLLAAFALWLGLSLPGGRARYAERNFRLQCWWAELLFWGSARIFGFCVELEGEDALDAGPMLLFIRHGSVADTPLAAVLIAAPRRIPLRYVLKRELLWDPCLDVVGNRLPNCFVRRDSDDSAREIERLRALIEDIRAGEGLLVYPEGTRFTEAKRERVIQRLRRSGHEALARRAEALRCVLPPRLGGSLALLESNPGLDVVVCAHTGFEGASTFWDLWNGALRGAEVRARFWRIPFASLPTTRETRVDWLFEQWSRVDDWVAHARRPASAE